MNDLYYYRPSRKPLEKREEIVTEKILELANLIGIALAFSQFLSDGSFRLMIFAFGILGLFIAYLSVWYYLSRRY